MNYKHLIDLSSRSEQIIKQAKALVAESNATIDFSIPISIDLEHTIIVISTHGRHHGIDKLLGSRAKILSCIPSNAMCLLCERKNK